MAGIAQFVSHFIKVAEKSGHSVEVISLVKNEVKGCFGYNVCRYGKSCMHKDAFSDIVPKNKRRRWYCIYFMIVF